MDRWDTSDTQALAYSLSPLRFDVAISFLSNFPSELSSIDQEGDCKENYNTHGNGLYEMCPHSSPALEIPDTDTTQEETDENCNNRVNKSRTGTSNLFGDKLDPNPTDKSQ